MNYLNDITPLHDIAKEHTMGRRHHPCFGLLDSLFGETVPHTERDGLLLGMQVSTYINSH